MKYRQIGSAAVDAPTVILSAGLGGLGQFWQPQLDELSKAFRVLVYDHRGTGENAEVLPTPYTIDHMADDVEAIAEASGTRTYHFVGHALGGLVGLALSRRQRSQCVSLCLVNSWASLDTQTARCFDMRLALLDHVGVEAYVKAQPLFLYPAVWSSVNAERVEKEVEHGVLGFQGASNLRARVGALRAFDASVDLERIAIPVLIAASKDDILVPFTCSETLAKSLPRGRLWIIPHGGHAFTVTEPSPFNLALSSFIAEASRE
ncbi:pyrimidine utilization protein D [Bradyrhizobium sp. BR 10289]|uniref:pyrimidine utilization protein D n=1 Tax=Bradyrhizobium sp. BR 10289 TaxID=2749993 RepID=UPI001C64DE75|nr:pyrimidine utilization protein D [Bradyrhizobium sp. BR 10289]MBW7970261.1 pyrimidine utilization protein D [Bradyrhizobium sp. BR 10289]